MNGVITLMMCVKKIHLDTNTPFIQDSTRFKVESNSYGTQIVR
jgi:hypothetical protein